MRLFIQALLVVMCTLAFGVFALTMSFGDAVEARTQSTTSLQVECWHIRTDGATKSVYRARGQNYWFKTRDGQPLLIITQNGVRVEHEVGPGEACAVFPATENRGDANTTD